MPWQGKWQWQIDKRLTNQINQSDGCLPPQKKTCQLLWYCPDSESPDTLCALIQGVLERRQWHWHPRRPIKELHTSQEKILPHCKWVWLVGNKSIAMPPLSVIVGCSKENVYFYSFFGKLSRQKAVFSESTDQNSPTALAQFRLKFPPPPPLIPVTRPFVQHNSPILS